MTRQLLFVAPLALLAACATHGPSTARDLLAITNATVIDGTGAPPAAGRTLLVRDGRIVDIGPAGEVRVPRGARVLDAGGAYAIPGLWDMHVHALWDTAVAERFLPAFVAHGVTGIRDMGGSLQVLRHARGRIAMGGLEAPRIVAAGAVLDGPEPVDPSISIRVSTAADVVAAVDSLARAGADFVKVYTLMPPELFRAAAARARERGMPLAGHVPGEVDPRDAARAGMRSMEHMRAELGGFCTRTTAAACDSIIPVLREHRVWQTPTLLPRWVRAHMDSVNAADARLAALPTVVRDYWIGERAGKLAERTADDWRRLRGEHDEERWLAGYLHRNGLALLAGSDAGVPFSHPGAGLHDELAMLVEAGLTPMEALQAATRNAAQALGADSLGTLEVGKVADVVLLAANPLDDIRNTRRIVAVVIGGRVRGRAALDVMMMER
jgi:imidazolonepropionase-like amidohydrolase